MPKLLPGLNFIAGLNGNHTDISNEQRLATINSETEGLWLRRINIRQVEGEGFQEIPGEPFTDFKPGQGMKSMGHC